MRIADVAVVAGDEPARVQTPADLDDVGAELVERDVSHRLDLSAAARPAGIRASRTRRSAVRATAVRARPARRRCRRPGSFTIWPATWRCDAAGLPPDGALDDAGEKAQVRRSHDQRDQEREEDEARTRNPMPRPFSWSWAPAAPVRRPAGSGARSSSRRAPAWRLGLPDWPARAPRPAARPWPRPPDPACRTRGRCPGSAASWCASDRSAGSARTAPARDPAGSGSSS